MILPYACKGNENTKYTFHFLKCSFYFVFTSRAIHVHPHLCNLKEIKMKKKTLIFFIQNHEYLKVFNQELIDECQIYFFTL